MTNALDASAPDRSSPRRPNNGMYPTRNSAAFILDLLSGRVMPGVRCLAVCLDEFYTENLDHGVNFSRNYSY
jgi:hypothetical protein